MAEHAFGNYIDSGASETPFSNPFYQYATRHMPDSLPDVFKMSQHLWLTDSNYRVAMQRVVRYYLTQVELSDVSDDERDKWLEFLNNFLHINDLSAEVGEDYCCYGNSFTSIIVPFRRFLVCPKCSFYQPIERVKYVFTEAFTFKSKCVDPKCKYEGEFKRVDLRTAEQDKLRIKRWSPYEMNILFNTITQDYIYEWEIPAAEKREIKQGRAQYIEKTPWEIIEAVKNESQYFRFNANVIYHMAEKNIAGLKLYGWGLPPILSNFKQAWLLQVLRRYNEALVMDFIVPFRLISPPKSTGPQDILLHSDLNDFTSAVQGIIDKHRDDPTAWHVSPHAFEYQLLGGEGKELVPYELLEFEKNSFLNGLGVPIELYTGTIEQVQAMPTALRLFQRLWSPYLTKQNEWLGWLVSNCAKLLSWEQPTVKWQEVMLAEDMERKQILLQLASGAQISKATAYAPYGIEWKTEVRRMFEEEREFNELMKTHQEDEARRMELEQQMRTGVPTPGVTGMPPMGAGSGGAMPQQAPGQITPEVLMTQAEEIAYQLLAMPYEARRKEMHNMKQSNQELHAMVVAKMQEIRQQAKSEGGAQILAGLQSGMPPM